MSLKRNSIYVLSLIWLLSSASCDLIKMKENANEAEKKVIEPIARVHSVYLYPDDISGIIPKGSAAADSTYIAERYIKSWVRKQLLMHEAASNINFDEAELERKILDYKYALMAYEFEKLYVNRELDTEVSEEEIKQYYNENIENFQLKQNIVRAHFVKLPKNTPKLARFKKIWVSTKEKEIEELRSYIYRFALSSSMDENSWFNFDDVVRNSPYLSVPNKVQFLKTNKLSETEDEEFIYFLRIFEYKIVDELPPMEFVREQIQSIILNKRKVALSQKLEQKVYDKALKNKDFEIFN
jgi:hypothetical protein